jgi:hypothetical protein
MRLEFEGYPKLQLHKKQGHGTALARMVHLTRLGTGTTAHLSGPNPSLDARHSYPTSAYLPR